MHDKNSVKSDCANIKLDLQIHQKSDNQIKIIELANKNRRVHGWEYDFPDFKTPWQRNIERLIRLRK